MDDDLNAVTDCAVKNIPNHNDPGSVEEKDTLGGNEC